MRRDAKVLGNYHRDGVGANAETELLLEQQSVVRIEAHPEYHVARQVRTTAQVLAFREQR